MRRTLGLAEKQHMYLDSFQSARKRRMPRGKKIHTNPSVHLQPPPPLLPLISHAPSKKRQHTYRQEDLGLFLRGLIADSFEGVHHCLVLALGAQRRPDRGVLIQLSIESLSVYVCVVCARMLRYPYVYVYLCACGVSVCRLVCVHGRCVHVSLRIRLRAYITVWYSHWARSDAQPRCARPAEHVKERECIVCVRPSCSLRSPSTAERVWIDKSRFQVQ